MKMLLTQSPPQYCLTVLSPPHGAVQAASALKLQPMRQVFKHTMVCHAEFIHYSSVLSMSACDLLPIPCSRRRRTCPWCCQQSTWWRTAAPHTCSPVPAGTHSNHQMLLKACCQQMAIASCIRLAQQQCRRAV
jgi:hypothetical protein